MQSTVNKRYSSHDSITNINYYCSYFGSAGKLLIPSTRKGEFLLLVYIIPCSRSMSIRLYRFVAHGTLLRPLTPARRLTLIQPATATPPRIESSRPTRFLSQSTNTKNRATMSGFSNTDTGNQPADPYKERNLEDASLKDKVHMLTKFVESTKVRQLVDIHL